MNTPSAFARVEAKPDKAEDLAALASALTPRRAESGTVDWYAARTSPTAFWIFDTLGTEQDRQARISGEIAAAVLVKADELLDGPPEILLGQETVAGESAVMACVTASAGDCRSVPTRRLAFASTLTSALGGLDISACREDCA